MNNPNKCFWEEYYMNHKDDIKKNSSFSEFVYNIPWTVNSASVSDIT